MSFIFNPSSGTTGRFAINRLVALTFANGVVVGAQLISSSSSSSQSSDSSLSSGSSFSSTSSSSSQSSDSSGSSDSSDSSFSSGGGGWVQAGPFPPGTTAYKTDVNHIITNNSAFMGGDSGLGFFNNGTWSYGQSALDNAYAWAIGNWSAVFTDLGTGFTDPSA